MQNELLALARARGGIVATRQAAVLGLDAAVLAKMVRAEVLHKVRRGAFVVRDIYDCADEDEKYRLRVRAILATRGERDAAAHHAGAALYRLPLVGVDLARVDVCGPVRTLNTENGLVSHPWPKGHGCCRVGADRVLPVESVVTQMIATSGVEPAVIAMDAALGRGLCTVSALKTAAADLSPRWATRAARALAWVDPACESPGESRTRVLLHTLGFPVRSQVNIVDAVGLVGRVDFLLWGCVVVEFDGLVKYSGGDAARVVAAEKRREERLKALGYEVVRLVWSDLSDPARVRVLLEQARCRAFARLGGDRSPHTSEDAAAVENF